MTFRAASGGYGRGVGRMGSAGIPTDVVIPNTSFDPTNKSVSVTLSVNNTTMSSDTNDRGVKGIKPITTGKVAFEVQIGSVSGGGNVGVASSSQTVENWVGQGPSIGLDISSGDVYTTSAPLGATGLLPMAAFDVIGVYVDYTASKLWFSRNGAFDTGQNPTTNTGGFSFTGSMPFLMVSAYAGQTFILRTTSLQYAVPSGYTSWGT